MGENVGATYLGSSGSGSVLRLALRVSNRATVSSEILPGERSTSTPTPVGVAGFGSLQPVGLRPHSLAGFCPEPPSLPVS